MALVSYSSSDDSDSKAKVAPQQASRPPIAPGKPGFQKVVNRSNSHRIEIHLPEASRSSTGRLDSGEEPPAKKVRLGAGTFGDFNSLLPAPKRAITSHRPPSTKGAGRIGVAGDIRLKTGANPGFSPDAPVTAVSAATVTEEPPVEDVESKTRVGTPNLEPIEDVEPHEDSAQGPLTKANVAMFKPLSVARKPKKRKIEVQKEINSAKTLSSIQAKEAATMKKPSLFFAGDSAEVYRGPPTQKGDYRPTLYESAQQSGDLTNAYHAGEEHFEDSATAVVKENTLEDEGRNDSRKSQKTSQSLVTIAEDLNLSASAKRQLFGRNKTRTSDVSVVSFDTDQEYAANELLRQAGDQAQHNPVRSIAPGKHSLKQLVNAASHQKDALEEHFASGKRNKREAGSKYGW